MKKLLILALLPGVAAADGFWPSWSKLWGKKKGRYYVSKNSIQGTQQKSKAEGESGDDQESDTHKDQVDVVKSRKKLKGRYYVSKNSLVMKQKPGEADPKNKGTENNAASSEMISAHKPHGYSYIMLGFENIHYKENFGEGFGRFTSNVALVSPVLNSGSLFRLSRRFDFSIDALATFTPGHGTERWRDSTGELVQTDTMEYLKASTNVLLHYKWLNHFRLVAGPALSYQTFTRFGIQTNQSVFGDASTWEQKSTDVFMDMGVAYNTGSLFNDSKWLLNGRAIMGIPVWSRTKNTVYENKSFKDGGYRMFIEGTLSYQIHKGVHLGWYSQLGFEKRSESDPETVTLSINGGDVDTRSVTIPEGRNTYFSSGLQVFWNF